MRERHADFFVHLIEVLEIKVELARLANVGERDGPLGLLDPRQPLVKPLNNQLIDVRVCDCVATSHS